MLSIYCHLTTGAACQNNKFALSQSRYSECPPLALMHAINRLVKLTMDLSMDPAANHSASTEELLLALNVLRDITTLFCSFIHRLVEN